MPYLAEDDLRGEIFGGTAEGPGPPLHSLCETEIRDLDRQKDFPLHGQ
jgi:hypothetical protein